MMIIDFAALPSDHQPATRKNNFLEYQQLENRVAFWRQAKSTTLPAMSAPFKITVAKSRHSMRTKRTNDLRKIIQSFVLFEQIQSGTLIATGSSKSS